jgi:hypothetical protein
MPVGFPQQGKSVDIGGYKPGRQGLFNLIKSLPPTLRYEPGTIVAEGDS